VNASFSRAINHAAKIHPHLHHTGLTYSFFYWQQGRFQRCWAVLWIFKGLSISVLQVCLESKDHHEDQLLHKVPQRTDGFHERADNSSAGSLTSWKHLGAKVIYNTKTSHFGILKIDQSTWIYIYPGWYPAGICPLPLAAQHLMVNVGTITYVGRN